MFRQFLPRNDNGHAAGSRFCKESFFHLGIASVDLKKICRLRAGRSVVHILRLPMTSLLQNSDDVSSVSWI